LLIIKSRILSNYPEIIFGFSTKLGGEKEAPYYFNMSHSVGDNEKTVNDNRRLFFSELRLSLENVAYQKQIHQDTITFVESGGLCGESDAMITNRNNLGLAISTADCAAIFIYDPKIKLIAAVHSGWRGTSKKILLKTLIKLKNEFNSCPEDLIAYIAPSISRENYEVGREFTELFESGYLTPKGEKYLLDIPQVNYDILINFGLNNKNIQVSNLCSYELKEILHSYRRDGLHSGRAVGVIAMK
jgi:hypothetical protein